MQCPKCKQPMKVERRQDDKVYWRCVPCEELFVEHTKERPPFYNDLNQYSNKGEGDVH